MHKKVNFLPAEQNGELMSHHHTCVTTTEIMEFIFKQNA